MRILSPGYLKRRCAWLLDSQTFRQEPGKLVYRVASWEVARLIGRPVVGRLDDGLNIILYPSEGYSRAIHYFRFNKPFIARFYDRFFEPGMVYVDCGANIGVYSLFVAKRVEPSGVVYSFEPQPEIFHRLLANIHLNGQDNVHACRAALGDRVGMVELVRLRDHVASYVRPLRASENAASVCEVMTLDAFFADHTIDRLDALKIDVEGFEYKVLRGGRGLIERLRPALIQFEYYSEYPSLPRDEWPTLALYRSFFADVGYKGFFCVGKHTGRLEPLVEDRPQDNDLFCIERGAADRLRSDLFA